MVESLSNGLRCRHFVGIRCEKLEKFSNNYFVPIIMGVFWQTLGSKKPQCKLLCIDVTNLGDRPVSINGVGWRIGKRNKKRNSMQTPTHPASNKIPVKLSYGESANFLIQVDNAWRKEFVDDFVKDVSDKSLATLRAVIHTSVGYSKLIRPHNSLLEELRKSV